MITGTASTTSFVSAPSPTVELQSAPSLHAKVDLCHVAYRRDNTPYEDLLRALLQKTSTMQKELAALQNR